ncbi:NAD(P)/FAD-dependent oxidoreductase [Agromyces atrinae]|uniref:NAD(P)/FAD-dependent oxidoreductase n=1 Tax=Agromyces atrinae TaxID=592376 RepID=UPI001F57E4C5|nr:NAD(P)/FAD-dependent oxidoreductase [Agromyces atrinae]MCI2956644.1 NAD(P)/FAD-dependent oxidoreductase [Agromyces atrinae]
MTLTHDVLIIGGGTAGQSAALMLTRAGRRVAIIDAGEPRNGVVEHMHAVLGHDGVKPTDLLARGRRDIEGYGGEFVDGRAVTAVPVDGGFAVTLDAGDTLTARRLIVTTGLRDELPAIPGLREQWGRGVVTCPYCDGYEVRGRRIGVLATSAGGVHQAQLLRQWSPQVTYFENGTGMPEADVAAGFAARGVIVEPGPVAEVISTDGVLTAVVLADGRSIAIDSIFTAPTLVPNGTLLADLGAELTESPIGTVVAVDAFGATSVPGVWAAGNVVNPMANVPVSMGAGSMAGAAVNANLVQDDIARAVASGHPPFTTRG